MPNTPRLLCALRAFPFSRRGTMRTNITSLIAIGTLIVTMTIIAPVAWADENYYMVVFAYEGVSDAPREAHTFATFVKVDYAHGTDPKLGKIERHTISWLPATLDVRLLHPPEPGKNLRLSSTLKLGKSENATISAWGPYRIRKDLYDRALGQI